MPFLGLRFLITPVWRSRLEEVLGRKVDVVEEETLPWSMRPQILAEAVPL